MRTHSYRAVALGPAAAMALAPLAALVCAASPARADSGRFVGAATNSAGGAAANSLSATHDGIPAPVADELSRAAPFPGAQVHATRFIHAAGCSVESAELTAPLIASGRAAMRVGGRAPDGKPCRAYAFVEVRVTTDALVATRPIHEGAPLEGAVRIVRREIIAGETPLTQLPEGALAARTLAPGQLLQSELVRAPGLNPGSPVRVLVLSGALSLEESGRVVRCSDARDPTHACAQVESGKRVEGRYQDGAIVVEP